MGLAAASPKTYLTRNIIIRICQQSLQLNLCFPQQPNRQRFLFWIISKTHGLKALTPYTITDINRLCYQLEEIKLMFQYFDHPLCRPMKLPFWHVTLLLFPFVFPYSYFTHISRNTQVIFLSTLYCSLSHTADKVTLQENKQYGVRYSDADAGNR